MRRITVFFLLKERKENKRTMKSNSFVLDRIGFVEIWSDISDFKGNVVKIPILVLFSAAFHKLFFIASSEFRSLLAPFILPSSRRGKSRQKRNPKAENAFLNWYFLLNYTHSPAV